VFLLRILARSEGRQLWYSCAVLAELVERDDGLILGYRPSSHEEFLLAPIHPPLVAFSGPSYSEYITSCTVMTYATPDAIRVTDHMLVGYGLVQLSG
jgi:hypothetical protein